MFTKWWSSLPARQRRILVLIGLFDVVGLAYFLTQRDYGFVALTSGVLVVMLLVAVLGSNHQRGRVG